MDAEVAWHSSCQWELEVVIVSLTKGGRNKWRMTYNGMEYDI